MSWLINYTGTPEKIVEALDKHSEGLQGQSKTEFDSALPHMKALVLTNFNANGACTVELSGNGHAHEGYSKCEVSVKAVG